MHGKRVIVFGEVLFDSFPNRSEHLGGAPFNVAWHLQGMGLSPLMITRIGNDARGRAASAAMMRWGLDTRGVQVDPDRPTGLVRVALPEQGPRFEILSDQAYDHIEAEPALESASQGHFELIYCGSLAQRSPDSRSALRRLSESTNLPLFVDLNLRPPWYSPDTVHRLLHSARWLKLNDEELRVLLAVADPLTLPQCIEAGRRLCRELPLEFVAITRGEQGAIIVRQGEVHEGRPPARSVVSTVGAGDAFSAVLIRGVLSGIGVSQMLKGGLDFSSRVCELEGAISDDESFYALFTR